MTKNLEYYLVAVHDLYKKLVSILMFVLIKCVLPKAEYVGARTLKDRFKTSDSMFALATGASIGDYSEADFRLIKKSDSIGINFFILHAFRPTLYLIETHPNRLGYFRFFNSDRLNDTPILYKGYSSHKKISLAIKNAKSVPKSVKNFLVVKDGYQRGTWSSLPVWKKEYMLELSSSDFLYNGTASILYVVCMSYKLGYKNVILCGFDMSDKYFYCNIDHSNYPFASQNGLCAPSSVNTIHSDEDRKRSIIEMLVYMDNKFKSERGGGVFMFTKDGVLSQHLRSYGSV
ncbi:hypothetical protein OAB15_03705 [Porticoccaceae bacterium]|nr:hypothetical protein [Porticoccaceae bacterium]